MRLSLTCRRKLYDNLHQSKYIAVSWASAAARYGLHAFISSSNSSWIEGSVSVDQERREEALNADTKDEAKDDGTRFVGLLRTCTKNKDLRRGIQLHDDILRKGYLKWCSDVLVTMYAKCGALAKAREVFDMYQSRDVFTWTALIGGYAQTGQGQTALECFEQMQHEGLSPDAVTYTCVLKACESLKAANKGQRIHHEIAKHGLLGKSIFLGNALVNMYAKSGALATARRIFQELPRRDVISWNTLISGYAELGDGKEALNCYDHMRGEGLPPDAATFVFILKACGSIGAVDKGKQIHDEIHEQGLLGNDVVVGTALVDMYAKCGALAKAREVFEELPTRNLISWTALIAGYVNSGKGEQALDCYAQMRYEGLSPDGATYSCILEACGSIGAVDKGDEVHDRMVEQGLLGNDAVLDNSLIGMYAKCGALTKARGVLEACRAKDIFAWNALIAGYVDHGEGEEALKCFSQIQEDGLFPNAMTYACILKACGALGAIDKGENFHDEIAKQGLLKNNIVLGTALVDMYAKCGALAKAWQVLDELSGRDVIAWTALMSGYAEHGEGEKALICYEQMRHDGIFPNAATYVCVLKACGNVGAPNKGEKFHDEILEQGLLKDDIVLSNALVDMYAKCGALAQARRVLEELPLSDVISWTALIGGYAEHGEGEQALDCYDRMQGKGLSPNAATFICALQACASIGAADKGEEIHDAISKQGLLESDIVLGTALVQMYAMCSALTRAHKVLEELPYCNVIAWNVLVGGYAEHGEGAQALSCFEQMQHEGLSPDAATFSSVLCACSRVGLVDDAQMYFENMSTKFGLMPTVEHYTTMVDLFGRSGHLDRALSMIGKMPYGSGVAWSALLGACQKWGDAEVGREAFRHAAPINQSGPVIGVVV